MSEIAWSGAKRTNPLQIVARCWGHSLNNPASRLYDRVVEEVIVSKVVVARAYRERIRLRQPGTGFIPVSLNKSQ